MAHIFFKKSGRRPSVFATLGLIVMLLAVVCLLVAWPVLGYLQIESPTPEGIFELREKILVLSRLLLATGALFTVAGIMHGRISIRVRTSYRALLAALIGAGTALPLGYLEYQAIQHPLHDVTTNIMDPPQFELLNERSYDTQDEANMKGGRLDYKYEDTHRSLYPAVKTIPIKLPVSEALKQAQLVIQSLGWQRADGSLSQNQIEAQHPIPYLFMRTRIVIRVRPSAAGTGSILDFRALSPLGVSDYGAGERLYKSFRTALQESMANSDNGKIPAK